MSKSSSDIPRLAITAGDPAGIGPEIIAKALQRTFRTLSVRPVVVGNASILREAFERWAPAIALLSADSPVEIVGASAVPCVDPAGDTTLMYPHIPEAAYIEHAVRGCLSGTYRAMVTAPISKRAMYERGFRFPGHTEFIGHLTGVPHPTMMFVSKTLRVSLVTIHLPLGDVPAAVTTSAVERTIRATVDAARRWFGLSRPRVAVCGVNPHAGEEGHLGREETTAILPAIARTRDLAAEIHGPLPADTVFVRAIHGEFDLVVAQYHDQGLIPVKAFGFGNSVNLTAGVPIIRTSVDHGVAYDIAGQGKADPSSMESAIRLAQDLVRRR